MVGNPFAHMAYVPQVPPPPQPTFVSEEAPESPSVSRCLVLPDLRCVVCGYSAQGIPDCPYQVSLLGLLLGTLGFAGRHTVTEQGVFSA